MSMHCFLSQMIVFLFVYTDMNHSNITIITVCTVTMTTTNTPATTSKSCAPCTLNSTCIQTPPSIVSSGTSTCVGASWVGGVLVGVVSGVLVMIIMWVIVTVISKKSIIDRKETKERFSMTIINEFLSVIFLDHMMMGTN